MNQETIDKIRQALNNSSPWLYDSATNVLFVQPGDLNYKEVAFPSDLQSSIHAACLLLQHAPALLDEIERLTKENSRLRAAVEAADANFNQALNEGDGSYRP